MAKNFNFFGKQFKKIFNAVYYAKSRCHICKEEILANALVCPHCKTDFRTAPHLKRTAWQKKAMQIILIVALLTGIITIISGVPFVISITVAVIIYGGGYMLIQKIQKIKNYHH